MVAPLIAAGARVAARGAVKTGRKTKNVVVTNKPQPSENVRRGIQTLTGNTQGVQNAAIRQQQPSGLNYNLNSQADYSSVKKGVAEKKSRQQQEDDSRDYKNRENIGGTNDRRLLRKAIARQRQKKPSVKQELNANIKSTRRRLRALKASYTLLWPGVWVAGFILFFYLVSMFGIGTALIGESVFNWIPLFGDTLAELAGKPGQWIFGGAWIIGSVIGATVTALCAVWFAMCRVWWWRSGLLIFIFIISLSLSIAPFANFAPWYFLFVGMVALLYK